MSTREPISNVIIIDKNNTQTSTDQLGKADISALDKSSAIVLFHSSYLSYTLSAEDLSQTEIEIRLQRRTILLDEIILSPNRQSEHKIDVPYSVLVIPQKEIEFVNQQNSADLLQNTGSVFVQKSQMGGGSPVMRGFEANKVLIVLDGVRMNNAIYRAGHLQDVITLDANMLERTELLFGPSSTIYGSDALGGVMHFYTKNPVFSNSDKLLVNTNTFMRYSSANQEKTGHLDLNLGWKNFASITNITYSSFDDLMSGNTLLNGSAKSWDRNYYAERYETGTILGGTKVMRDTMTKNVNNSLQVGTAYSQLDLMQKFSLKSGQYLTHKLNFQYSSSSDIPRYDRLTEMSGSKLKYAEWNYGPQNRFLGAYTLDYIKSTRISDNIRIIAAYQKIDQDRISRRFQSTSRSTQMEDVKVMSLNADLFKRIQKGHELRYGTEVQMNTVTSKAETRNIQTDLVSPAPTRYADGGNLMNTLGIYVSDSWEVNKTFVISGGLRFTANQLKSEFKDTTFFKFPFTTAEQKNSALTGNFGLTWKEENNYKVSLLANTGFRTPNIDDMSKVFESSGNILIVPNPDIKPEYATNVEFGLSTVVNSAFKFDFNAFYTLLDRVLVQADYLFNGQDTILYNGTKCKVQAMQNKNSAYIYGFSAGTQIDFNPYLSVKGTINYTYGRYTDKKTDTVVALDHIPPVFGQFSTLYHGKSTDGEFFVRFNGPKLSKDYSPSGEDNAVYSADSKNGYMPGWFTLNVRIGYNITRNLRFNLACENLSDNRYRVFASGVNAPGRNFIISLRYKV
ncbi:MAG TPA: TonB-dependent receptor [Bacteroidia bacterium]|nr:TonB-dependent receptor [Bacteroidia bacterium]